LKRRKKKANPLRTVERKELKAWSKDVKERAENRCEWCGKTKYLNAHHIIGKRYKPLRFDRMNGVALCPKCHRFGIGLSAHQNPIRIVDWLESNRPEALKMLRDYTKEMLS